MKISKALAFSFIPVAGMTAGVTPDTALGRTCREELDRCVFERAEWHYRNTLLEKLYNGTQDALYRCHGEAAIIREQLQHATASATLGWTLFSLLLTFQVGWILLPRLIWLGLMIWRGVKNMFLYLVKLPSRIKSRFWANAGVYEDIPMTIRVSDPPNAVVLTEGGPVRLLFNQESLQPGSPLERMKDDKGNLVHAYPKCMFAVYYADPDFPNQLRKNGLGCWAKMSKDDPHGMFITAGHVVAGKGTLVITSLSDESKRVEMSADSWTLVDSVDIAVVRPTQKITSRLGLAMASTPNSIMTAKTHVTVYGDDVRSHSMAEGDVSNPAFVRYYGSTIPGFSGSPYMQNTTAVAVHVGSVQTTAYAVDMHYLKLLLMRKMVREGPEDAFQRVQLIPMTQESLETSDDEEFFEAESAYHVEPDSRGWPKKDGKKNIYHVPLVNDKSVQTDYAFPSDYPTDLDDTSVAWFDWRFGLRHRRKEEDRFPDYEPEGKNRWGGKGTRRFWGGSVDTPDWLEDESRRIAARGAGKMRMWRTGYEDYFVDYQNRQYSLDAEDAQRIMNAGGAEMVSNDVDIGRKAWARRHGESLDWDKERRLYERAVMKNEIMEQLRQESLLVEYAHAPEGEKFIKKMSDEVNAVPPTLPKNLPDPALAALGAGDLRVTFAPIPKSTQLEGLSPSKAGPTRKNLRGQRSIRAQLRDLLLDTSESSNELEQEADRLRYLIERLSTIVSKNERGLIGLRKKVRKILDSGSISASTKH